MHENLGNDNRYEVKWEQCCAFMQSDTKKISAATFESYFKHKYTKNIYFAF